MKPPCVASLRSPGKYLCYNFGSSYSDGKEQAPLSETKLHLLPY